MRTLSSSELVSVYGGVLCGAPPSCYVPPVCGGGSGSKGRGSKGRGSKGRGSKGRGSKGRGSKGRGSKGRGGRCG